VSTRPSTKAPAFSAAGSGSSRRRAGALAGVHAGRHRAHAAFDDRAGGIAQAHGIADLRRAPARLPAAPAAIPAALADQRQQFAAGGDHLARLHVAARDDAGVGRAQLA
jgi:hypothetical protein